MTPWVPTISPEVGEVRRLDPFDHRGQGGLFIGVMVVQAPVHPSANSAQVVRRDVGGHTDGDAARAVGQQVGEPTGQNCRLLDAPVVVRDEIDCLLIDFTKHLHRQGVRRASVYRIAAAGSLPGEPKLPWPSTRGSAATRAGPSGPGCRRSRHHRAGGSYPIVSATDRADFAWLRSGRNPESYIAYRTRRCTGLRPSRTSGNARPTITLIA